jgi:hypothetical protein
LKDFNIQANISAGKDSGIGRNMATGRNKTMLSACPCSRSGRGYTTQCALIAATALLILSLAQGLKASAYLMGGIKSVHAYGAQDTVRNPALLARQDQDSALGLFANYKVCASSNISLKQAELSLTRFDLDRYNAGNARVTYARKINITTLGLDLYAGQETSDLKRKSFLINIMGNIVPGIGVSKKTQTQTAATASLGIAINPMHSIGIQINCNYLKNGERARSSSIQLSSLPVYVYSYNNDLNEYIFLNTGIGYHCKLENAEIGIMFAAGRLNWEKNTKEGFSYDVSPILTQLLFKAKGKLPYTFSFNQGPGLIIGCYSRPMYDIAAGLELELTFPLSYDKKFLLEGRKLSPGPGKLFYLTNSAIRMKMKVLTRPSVAVRGGFEFYLSGRTIFSLGSGLIYDASQTEISGIVTNPFRTGYFHNYTSVVYGTTGFDFLAGKNSIITIGMIISGYLQSQEETYREIFLTAGKEIHNSNLKIKSMNIDFIAAVSIGF